MRYALSIITLLTICSDTFAQQTYVEVTVSESVELIATEFVTILSDSPGMEDWEEAMEELEDYPEYEDPERDEDVPQLSEPAITFDQLRKVLTKEKFKFKVLYHIADAEDGEAKWEIEVTSPTLEDVTRLKNRVEPENSVHSEFKGVLYEDIDRHLPKTYPMLQEKAKKRGQILASSAGKKLGEVLQITEGEVNSSNSFDSDSYMEMIIGMMDREKNKLNMTKKETISLTYRFALN